MKKVLMSIVVILGTATLVNAQTDPIKAAGTKEMNAAHHAKDKAEHTAVATEKKVEHKAVEAEHNATKDVKKVEHKAVEAEHNATKDVKKVEHSAAKEVKKVEDVKLK